MFGLNPVASGILVGTMTGGLGAYAAYSYEAGKEQQREAEKAMRREQGKQVTNANALVQANYDNKKAARGLADSIKNPQPGAPLGEVSSQSGSALNSVTNPELVNLLG